jgi:hypothetical protein
MADRLTVKRPHLSTKTNREEIHEAQDLVSAQLHLVDPEPTGVDNPRKGDEPYDDGEGLGSAKGLERHAKRWGWFVNEASRQSHNRQMMAKCEAFYDSEQWEAEDAQIVRDRGQNPVVYNEIKPTIDFLIGTERRSRVDFYVVAEDEGDEAEEDAQNKTKLLKYLDDVNKAAFERSYAAEDCFKAGLGWLEVGLRGDRSGVPIFIGAESWRNILWDSKAQRRDLSDARYFFRVKVVDLDIAEAIFPDKVEQLRAAAQTGDVVAGSMGWRGQDGLIGGLDAFNELSDRDTGLSGSVGAIVDSLNCRDRVMLIECWYREPMKRDPMVGGMSDPVEFRTVVAIMTESETLLEAESPYKHDGPPFIPIWCYRNRRTGLPYSLALPLLGPQEALNHRMSKSLYEASANQMEIEQSAIDEETGMGLEELRDEWNRPDGVAVYADGALQNNRVRRRDNPNAAKEQLMLAEADKQTIRAMSSVNEENRGLRSAATSRVAMDAKAERGSVGTAELFDNLLLARQMEGEITLSLAEQYVKQPITVRVAGESGSKVDRVKLNEPVAGGYRNDITTRRTHFVVGEQAWKQSYAEAAFESLMNVLTQLASAAPAVVVNLLDVVFEMHPNLPRKKAILSRIRAINGQQDENGKMTPEQAAAQQQKQALAKAQFEAEMAKVQAEIHKARAQGDKLDADAILTRVTALYEAAQAAQVIGMTPAITPIADEILLSAGYVQPAGGTPNVIGPEVANQAQGQLGRASGSPIQTGPGMGGPGVPQNALPVLQQGDGAQRGIETQRPDGAIPQ